MESSKLNATWVCCDCREAVPGSRYQTTHVPCPQCGSRCRLLGINVSAPPKGNTKAWHAVRAQLEKVASEKAEKKKQTRQRRIHALERKIKDLEALPLDAKRMERIRAIRQKLSDLTGEKPQ